MPEGSSRAREAREWCTPGGSDLPSAPRRPYFTRTHGARTRVPVRASYTLRQRFTRCFGRLHAAGGAGRPHASRGPPRRHGPWSQVAHVLIPPGQWGIPTPSVCSSLLYEIKTDTLLTNHSSKGAGTHAVIYSTSRADGGYGQTRTVKLGS